MDSQCTLCHCEKIDFSQHAMTAPNFWMTNAKNSQTAPKFVGSSQTKICLLPSNLGAIISTLDCSQIYWEQQVKMDSQCTLCHCEKNDFSQLAMTAPNFWIINAKNFQTAPNVLTSDCSQLFWEQSDKNRLLRNILGAVG